MPRTYLVEAVEFSGDQRPVRTGIYMRGGPEFANKQMWWSNFNARTKVWGCLWRNASRARSHRAIPGMHQSLPWYALPHQIPAGARIERVSGLTFRVTEA